MANKRMFALSIVDTDKFLEMPMTSRYLYYELGMRGDDDGFVSNPRKILRITGCRNDDLKKLAEEGYIKIFDSGILVITDWRTNNYIRSDRYQPTTHQSEYKLYYGGIPLGIPSGSVEQTRQDKISKEQQQEIKTERIVEKYNLKNIIVTLISEGHEQAAINHALLLLNSSKTKVRNPGAWLRAAVEGNWTDAEAERKEAARKENAEIAEAAREAMENDLKEAGQEELTTYWKEKQREHRKAVE